MEAPESQSPPPKPTVPGPSTSPGLGRVIAFMNQKGGVGKTTTTVNLAAALAQLDYRVLLIDLDPQAHLSLHVGLDPNTLEHSIYDLLLDDDLSAADVLQHPPTPAPGIVPPGAVRTSGNPSGEGDTSGGGGGLDVLPAEVNLAAAETELAGHPTRQLILRNKVTPLLDSYDYVMIDCPPSLGLLTLNALALAREVIVPMQAHFLALQGLSKLLETVQLVRGQVNPKLTVSGVVLCLHDPQTNLAREVVNDLESFFQSSRSSDVPWRNAIVYQPPIRRNIKLAECPSFGQTIFQYEPWCAGSRDYLNLAESIAGQ